MSVIWWQIVVGIVLIVASAFVNLWIIRRERIIKVPEDVSILTIRIQAVEELQQDVKELTSKVAYLEGRVNGRIWKPKEA